ncbi:MAG: beta-ketoacyl-[acyl-carrier-protein] synthase family protein [Pirellulales bacterium]
MSHPEAVWVTGAGCVSSVGNSPAALMDNILAGRSGIRLIDQYELPNHPSRIAAYVTDIPTPEGWDEAEFQAFPRWKRMLLSGTVAALRDAGLWEDRHTRRIGLVLGLGAEWMVRWVGDTAPPQSDMLHAQTLEVGVAGDARTLLEISGPVTTVAAACASGNYSFGVARQWLRQGLVDVCIAGGIEFSVNPMGLAGFGNLGALSRRNDAPALASRPFDIGRDGFVMGEGCGFAILESESHARRRSARPRCEVAGFGASSDAFHSVIPSTDPGPSSRAITRALADARVAPADVSYINAHATSTPVGDVFETKALNQVFGEDVGKPSISSTKSMTGHMLSAASAIESLICLGAIERQVAPPTTNLDEVDPECRHLNHVRNEARPQRVDVAISNSFGFGGSNTCLVLRRVA